MRPALSALLLAALASSGGAQLAPWDDPARVLVICNTNWPDEDGDGTGDSVEVAEYYAQRRGVPAQRVLGLPLTPTGVAYASPQWAQFLTELRDPVLAYLAAHGETSIDTLLFCYGVPYQVDVPGWGPRSVDNALQTPFALGTAAVPVFKSTKYNNPMKEVSPHIGEDIGHFDHALHDWLGTPLYMACRLDGRSAEHAKALVDRALYAQRHAGTAPGQYTGVGYVDTRFGAYDDATLLAGYPFSYGTYEQGDKSMAYGKFFVAASSFPLAWEPWETEIGEPGATFAGGASALWAPDALLYGGWYNYAKYQHAWEWLAGSVACDLNSNSAAGLRDAAGNSFLAQAFQENLTAGAGVIAEPYLNGHNRPEILLAYMIDGFTWAETAMISDPGLKWMSLHVGDPLYRIDVAGATPDVQAPQPWVWLAAGGAGLELELPTVAGGAPGGTEVFRCDALLAGSAPPLGALALAQPDDRRLQAVAVPASGGPLTLVSARCVDPSGNAAWTPVQHFAHGPTASASALVEADALAPTPSEPLTLRFSFGAEGGLLSSVTGFSMTITSQAFGVTDMPVHAILLPLAEGWLVDRSLSQANFTVMIPPGVWPADTMSISVSLTANGTTATDTVSLTLP